ncbi:hypothetical protein DRQ25_06725 [Candidatus Fermentibacteria bacterium]|nr:MAG: hypothetical protein DRQ25_06725 [Candidatus Fermentibacteria bacterium]
MIYLRNVVSLELDRDKCTGCGLCLKVCPHNVLARNGDCVQIVNQDACIECGACAMNCESEAIRVQSGVGCAGAILRVMIGLTSTPCCGPSDESCRTSCC